MMRGVFLLLTALDERWPPDGGYRNTVRLAVEDGDGYVLQLDIRRDGKWEVIMLEHSDLERGVEDLMREIEGIFNARAAAS